MIEKDFEFSSPSAAAAVIHSGKQTGLQHGRIIRLKTIKQMEAD